MPGAGPRAEFLVECSTFVLCWSGNERHLLRVRYGGRPLGPRADVLHHSARLRKAEAELRTVLEQDPVEDYARLMLGRTLERQERSAEALPHLRMAAALHGDFPAG
jgi:hypothetical protein